MSATESQAVKILKIMLVGDTNVGKTVFLKQYVTGEFVEGNIPTVGIDFMKKSIVRDSGGTLHESYLDYDDNPWTDNDSQSTADNPSNQEFCENAEDEEKPARNLNLQLWDTAGQERYQSISTAYYRSARGFVLMFDVTREKSFQNLDKWIENIKTYAFVSDPKIILCGNKVDKADDRQIDVETAKKKAEQLGLEYFETSASTGENVNEAMDCLVHLIMVGRAPDEESDDEEVDEEAVKKDVEAKVKLAEEEEKPKENKKCAC